MALKPATPSSAERFGGDPGIGKVHKATPEEREAAKRRFAELQEADAAVTDAQKRQDTNSIE